MHGITAGEPPKRYWPRLALSLTLRVRDGSNSLDPTLASFMGWVSPGLFLTIGLKRVPAVI